MTFDRALAFVLEREGGFVDHPADRGGATNRGITQGAYDDYRTDQRLPTRSVKEVEEAELHAIYLERYWTTARCGQLPPAIALAHFDAAVNHGPAQAARMLQRAADVTADGIIGPVTMGAVLAKPPKELLRTYLCVRLRFYADIVARDATQQVFLKGWLARLDHLQKATTS